MKAAVVTFPGSNCDRDLAVAFETAGFDVARVWHKETELPSDVDVIGLPGGFSYGDYLRCGAIAAQSPICTAVKSHADAGGMVLGICNGFQVLIEMGLLPGALMRNAGLTFVCRTVPLVVSASDSPFLDSYTRGQQLSIPVAHHDGNFFADADTLAQIEAEERVAFRYLDNPNGSQGDIAGILSENRRVLGMMPHPERANDPKQGGTDGVPMFAALTQTLVTA